MPSIGSADLPQRLAPIDTTSLRDAEPGLLVLPAAMRPVEMRLWSGADRRRARGTDAGADWVGAVAPGGCPGPCRPSRPRGRELVTTEALRPDVAGIVIDGRCIDSHPRHHVCRSSPVPTTAS